MELSEFEQSVLNLREQLNRILAMVSPDQASDAQLAQLAFDQLFEAVEELQVAQEELRAQNEELESASLEARQAEARYLDLFEFAPDGYLVSDEHGTILQANRAALDLIKASLEQLVGKPLLVFIENKDHKRYLSLLLESKVGTGTYDLQTSFKRMDGTRFEAAIRIASPPASRVGKPHLFWLIRDISYQKQLEDELRQANRDLNTRVEERTRELKEQLDRREKAERESIENSTRLEVQHRLINESEKERQRISRELHDGPLQDLIGITFGLQELALDAQDPDLSGKLRGLQDTLQGQISVLRNFAGELRPPALVKFGLESAIRSHLGILGEKHPEIRTHLEASLRGEELSETTRLALYRIYQHAVNNILRHAGATEIRVTLARDPRQIELTIQDNGRGFTLPARWTDLARDGHLGIAGMVERAEAINGSLQVISQPGQGTTTRVIIPTEQ